jgi:hypothetical protein
VCVCVCARVCVRARAYIQKPGNILETKTSTFFYSFFICAFLVCMVLHRGEIIVILVPKPCICLTCRGLEVKLHIFLSLTLHDVSCWLYAVAALP